MYWGLICSVVRFSIYAYSGIVLHTFERGHSALDKAQYHIEELLTIMGLNCSYKNSSQLMIKFILKS